MMRWLILFSFFVQSTYGEVLVKGKDTPELEYRATLKAYQEYSSPTETLLRSLPLSKNKNMLVAEFLEAQDAFLSNSHAKARTLFESIVQKSTLDDWSKAEREILLHSSLRLAQIEGSSELQKNWLERSLTFGADIHADPQLFPPPLLESREQIRVQLAPLSLPSAWFEQGWRLVLVNGVPCSSSECSPLVKSKYPVRLTFLSDELAQQTAIVNSDEVKTVRPKRVTLVTGGCESEKWDEAAMKFGKKSAYWGEECERRGPGLLAKSHQQLDIPPNTELDLHPKAAHEVSAQEVPTLKIQENSSGILRNKWFWTGVGVVTAVVIISQSQKKSESEPTTSYGY